MNELDASGSGRSCDKDQNFTSICIMEIIDQSIHIDLPLQTVYNQWTRFEDFPLFMNGVTEVRQLDCDRVEWQVKLGGKKKTWLAEIIEQEPDTCIAWRSTNGVETSGRVVFSSLGANCTRIHLHLNYKPEGIFEKAASALGLVRAKVVAELLRFKEFIEGAIVLPEGWRGTIGGSSFHQEETVKLTMTATSSHKMIKTKHCSPSPQVSLNSACVE